MAAALALSDDLPEAVLQQFGPFLRRPVGCRSAPAAETARAECIPVT